MVRVPVVTVLALIFLPAASAGQPRFLGLDRVYFEHIAEPHQQATLPELAEPGVSRELELPANSWGRRVRIREHIDHTHPRIARTWWILYDGATRGDVWRYQASPSRNDDKMLANYCLDSILATGRDTVVLRVRGEMFRPGGAWWVTGKEFRFLRDDTSLVFHSVLNTFGLFSGYDRGDRSGKITVTTESAASGRYVTSKADSVADSVLKVCGFMVPHTDDEWTYRWSALLRFAECVLGRSRTVRSFRALDERCFAERAR